MKDSPTRGGEPRAAPTEIAARLLEHLDGWAASTLLAIGFRLGLVDAILGLDTDPDALAIAHRRATRLGLTNVTFRCADALQDDLAEPADAILVINLLHEERAA